MSNAVPFLIQGKNVILVIDGKSHTISRDTHISYNKIIDALKSQDWDALRNLVSPVDALANFGKGYVSINDGKVFWKGKEFHNALATRMIEMYKEGFPIDSMVKFMENLMQNPSMRSVDQLYGFLEKNKLPITEDGHFLAFKRVREDYLDIHSGTIDNSVGQVVSMTRNQVNDNPNETCSHGLHFCSEEYLTSFGHSGQPVMILKINPADVVSIPVDYNGSKGRCCRYEVVAEVKGDAASAFASVVDTNFSNNEDSLSSNEEEDFIDYESESYTFARINEDLYDVCRVNGGDIVETDITLDEARAMVEKNIRQKKAKLMIVKSGTNIQVS